MPRHQTTNIQGHDLTPNQIQILRGLSPFERKTRKYLNMAQRRNLSSLSNRGLIHVDTATNTYGLTPKGMEVAEAIAVQYIGEAP